MKYFILVMMLLFIACNTHTQNDDPQWIFHVHVIGCTDDKLTFVNSLGYVVNIDYHPEYTNTPPCNAWNASTYWDIETLYGEYHGQRISK